MFVFVNLIDPGVELVLSPLCIRKNFFVSSLMLPPLDSFPSPSPAPSLPPPKRIFFKTIPCRLSYTMPDYPPNFPVTLFPPLSHNVPMQSGARSDCSGESLPPRRLAFLNPDLPGHGSHGHPKAPRRAVHLDTLRRGLVLVSEFLALAGLEVWKRSWHPGRPRMKGRLWSGR